MKLITTFFIANGVTAAKVKCMAKDNPDFKGDANNSPIEMIATVNNDEIKHDLTTDKDWSCKSGVCTRSWKPSEFTGQGEMYYEGDTNLVLKKSIEAACKSTKVDGVNVCLQEGHKIDFTCKYPLGTRTIKNTFDVSGHDADVDAEGVGELKYTLSVADNNVDIGNKVAVTVSPVNKNLVFAQLNDCNVQYNKQSVSILDFNASLDNLQPVCAIGANVVNGSGQSDLAFGWKAFKWATAVKDAKELQTISCTISLSEKKPTASLGVCASPKPKFPKKR